jgi:HPt (histidine-containing phosphotransfer) domain-containing protein
VCCKERSTDSTKHKNQIEGEQTTEVRGGAHSLRSGLKRLHAHLVTELHERFEQQPGGLETAHDRTTENAVLSAGWRFSHNKDRATERLQRTNCAEQQGCSRCAFCCAWLTDL